MAERALFHPKIRFEWDSAVVAIHGQDKVSAVTLSDVNTGRTRDLSVTGLFIAIGHDPRSELVRDVLDVDADGYVVVQERTSRTSLAGVFAAGDLVDRTYRQAITAAGTGCSAAIDAERWLAEASETPEMTADTLIGAPR